MQKIVAVRYYEGVLEDSDVEYVNNLIRAGWSIKMISTFETEHLLFLPLYKQHLGGYS